MSKLFLLLGRLIVVSVILYTLAWVFNLLPANLTPGTLAEQGFANFKAFVAKDRTSTSMTAGMSKYISDYMENAEKAAAQKKIADAEQEKAEAENTPMSKAKEAIKSYEQQIQNEKKELDSL